MTFLGIKLRRKQYHAPGHADYCDCGECMQDGGKAQSLRRYGCACTRLPVSVSSPTLFTHYEPTCPKYGQQVTIGG